MVKRTTAQRRAAAKKAWALRKLRSAGLPTKADANPNVWVKPRSLGDLLGERGTTHGDFGLNAEVSQRIKAVFEWAMAQNANNDITAIQKESADLIATKFGRIFSGRADYAEHWDDIAGYATLVSKHLQS